MPRYLRLPTEKNSIVFREGRSRPGLRPSTPITETQAPDRLNCHRLTRIRLRASFPNLAQPSAVMPLRHPCARQPDRGGPRDPQAPTTDFFEPHWALAPRLASCFDEGVRPSKSFGHASRRMLSLVVVVSGLLLLAGEPGVASTRLPDLVLVSVTGPPTRLPAGSRFSEALVESNAGLARARRSTTTFYLSPSQHLGGHAIRLLGVARIRALHAKETARVTVHLTVPVSVPARSYSLIACANTSHSVTEGKTGNDCRTARRRTAVTTPSTAPTTTTTTTGTTTTTTTGTTTTATTTGAACVPTRHPPVASTSAGCFAGDAAHGVFVSLLGDDTNPGTMAAPKRTLAAGVSAAAAKGYDVYVSTGLYPEVLTVSNGVSVFGGYDGSWQRSTANVTKITGSGPESVAAIASGITTPTTLQLLTLAPTAPTLPGHSSYGLRGVGSTALALDHVTVIAAPGTPGGPGADGARGANGSPGVNGSPGNNGSNGVGGAGGAGAAGHSGGTGGSGGWQTAGGNGSGGHSLEPDAWGSLGGPGGTGGQNGSEFTAGGAGSAGDSGHVGTEGAAAALAVNAQPGSGTWLSTPGQSGTTGSAGHGGGGGGGGADNCLFANSPQGGGGGGGGGGQWRRWWRAGRRGFVRHLPRQLSRCDRDQLERDRLRRWSRG